MLFIYLALRYPKSRADGNQNLNETVYKKWIESVLSPPGSAFFVIDMQNDFLTGSLALKDSPAKQDGREIIDPINKFLDEASDNFDAIVYSMDWHPSDHISFLSNALMPETLQRQYRVIKQANSTSLGVSLLSLE